MTDTPSRDRSAGHELIEDLQPGEAGQSVVKRPGFRVRLLAPEIDRLGVLLEAIKLDHVRGRIGDQALRGRLKTLSDTVDYLSERLILVEHDPARTGALLRSENPRQVGEDRDYFELRVEKDRSAAFRRYRQPPGAADRHPVPILLDRPTLARLVDDLLAALTA